MSPMQRALRETQVSLERQKRQLDLRRNSEKLCMAAEEDLVNRACARDTDSERGGHN